MKRRHQFQPNLSDLRLESRIVLSRPGLPGFPGASPAKLLPSLPLAGVHPRYLGAHQVNDMVSSLFAQFESTYFSAAHSAVGSGSASKLSSTTSQLGQQLHQGTQFAVSRLPGSPVALQQKSQVLINNMLNQLQQVNQVIVNQGSSSSGSSSSSSSSSNPINNPTLSNANQLIIATNHAIQSDVLHYSVRYHALMRAL